jgi:Flp pilus assembly protein TadG
MRRGRVQRKGERGSALVEFAIGALVFMTATFGVLEFSRLLWTHNALSDAARRAARYAVNHASTDETAVKNVAVYGNPEGTGNAQVTNLRPENIVVSYTNSPVTGIFGYPDGAVTVEITNYEFRFVIPFVTRTLTMPEYSTTLTAESAGMIPPDVTPTPTPGPGGGTPTPTPPATPTPPPPTPTPPPAPTPTPEPTPTPRPS